MTPIARLEIGLRGDVPVARIVGEIDISNADQFSRRILAAVPNEAAGLIVDLGETAYLDSAGARLLLDLAARLRRRQQQLRVVIPDASPVRRILTLAHVDLSIPLDPSVEAAAVTLQPAAPGGGSP